MFELNTFGGNDTLDHGARRRRADRRSSSTPARATTATGGDEADTFFGGLGNDTLDPGAGADAVDGQDGDDTLMIRDGAADLARGGAGTDTATVDAVDAVAPTSRRSTARSRASTRWPCARTPRSPRSKKGRYSAKLVLKCDASALEGCKGTLALLTAKR